MRKLLMLCLIFACQIQSTYALSIKEENYIPNQEVAINVAIAILEPGANSQGKAFQGCFEGRYLDY